MKPPSRLFSGSSSASAAARTPSIRAGTAPSLSDDAVELLRQTEHSAARGEMRGERAGAANGIAHGAEIARTAAPERQPGQRAGKIGRALQRFAERAPQPRLAREIADHVETRIDGARIGQRTAEAARQLARAGAGHGAVDGSEQAAGARALVGAHQLEIGAVAASMISRLPGSSLRGGADQRGAADLGDLDIGEQPGKRGELGLGEIGIAVERGDAEAGLQRTLATQGIEMGARDRSERGASLLDRRRRTAASPARSSPTRTSRG